jgi:hypothetical protein
MLTRSKRADFAQNFNSRACLRHMANVLPSYEGLGKQSTTGVESTPLVTRSRLSRTHSLQRGASLSDGMSKVILPAKHQSAPNHSAQERRLDPGTT